MPSKLPPALEAQKLVEQAKTERVEHAKEWLEAKLREHDGPWARSSAVMVITAKPLLDQEGKPTGEAYLEQSMLPDMDVEHIIASLEQFAAKLRSMEKDQPDGKRV